MSDETKFIIENIGTVLNFLFAVGAFIMTLVLNKKNQKLEKRMDSLRAVLDKEIDLKMESKRMARDKVLELYSFVDNLFEKIKKIDDGSHSDIERYLKIDLRNKYFESIIYIPNLISNKVMLFMISVTQALSNYYANQEKFWDIMTKEISPNYVEIVNAIRKLYYFDSEDLSPLLERELSKLADEE